MFGYNLKNNKSNFRKWLLGEKNNLPLKKSTANLYVTLLNILDTKLQEMNVINKSVFELESYEELYNAYEFFDESEDLKELYKNNGYYYNMKNSFNRYLVFFKSEILGEEVEVLKDMNNRRLFRTWLNEKKNTRDEYYSPNTINQYMNILSNVNSILNSNGIIETEIYEINDIEELKKVFLKFNKLDVTEQFNGKPLTTVINLYLEFILSQDNNLQIEQTYDLNSSYKQYSIQNFIDDVFIDNDKYTDLKSRLLKKKNIIIEGVPGVGKTYLSKRLAYSILGEKNDNNVEMVQFHQNYSYEDFVMGYRPTSKGSYEIKYGVFYTLCEKARKDLNNKYFLIIDEINRGNLSKIFGELLLLLETDKRGVEYSIPLLYKPNEKFFVPENLYIIGLMNTADRSLAFMDYALRRRFSFINIEPQFKSHKFNLYLENCKEKVFLKNILNVIENINNEIKKDETLGKNFVIGHSYFCGLEHATKFDIKEIVMYEIIPLLEEYWINNDKKFEIFKNELMGVIKYGEII